MKGRSKGQAEPPPFPTPGKGKGKTTSRNRPISVTVRRGLEGTEGVFKSYSANSVLLLKEQITQHWGVPVLCQRLMLDTGSDYFPLLVDREHLQKYCGTDVDHICVVLIISEVEACSRLSSDYLDDRMQALAALSQLALQGSWTALNSVIGCLKDQDDQAHGVEAHLMRIEAARGLASVAKTGVEDAISALNMCVGFAFQDDLNAATAATEALALLVGEDNTRAWTVTMNLMLDPDLAVKREAVKILAIGAFFYSNMNALASLHACLEHRDESMRCAAVASVAFAAHVGDTSAMAVLVSRLEDASEAVRKSAVAGIGTVANPGDEAVVTLLLKMLQATESILEDVLLAALAKVARHGDEKVITVLSALVRDASGQSSALISLAKLANQADDVAIEALISRLGDSDWNVRGAAIAAITRLACHNDARLNAALAAGAHDSNADVRIVSAAGLAHCARHRNKEAFTILVGCKDDVDSRVRGIAEKLATCAEKAISGDAIGMRVCHHTLNQLWSQWGLGGTLHADEKCLP